MKTIIATIAATLFTVGVGATELYYGLGEGNSDLSTQRLSADDFVGVQPSIGDGVDRYHGLADRNPDLFQSDRGGPSNTGDDPDIYLNISGNPDVTF